MLWATLGGATIVDVGAKVLQAAALHAIMVGATEYFRQRSVGQLCLQGVGPSSSTQQGYNGCGTATQLGYYGLGAWMSRLALPGPQWAGRGNDLCPRATLLCL